MGGIAAVVDIIKAVAWPVAQLHPPWLAPLGKAEPIGVCIVHFLPINRVAPRAIDSTELKWQVATERWS